MIYTFIYFYIISHVTLKYSFHSSVKDSLNEKKAKGVSSLHLHLLCKLKTYAWFLLNSFNYHYALTQNDGINMQRVITN